MNLLIVTGASPPASGAPSPALPSRRLERHQHLPPPLPRAGRHQHPLRPGASRAPPMDWPTPCRPGCADAAPVCLVHNASAMHLNRVDTLASADLRATLELNLVAPNALNRIVIPHLPPGSSILYIGSTLAEKAVPGVAGYVIAKHGLVGMMRATCQDLAGRGIHTCMICPGFTDTEQLRALIGDNAGDPGRHHRPVGLRPADRAGGDRRGGRLRRPRPGAQRRPDPCQPGAAGAMTAPGTGATDPAAARVVCVSGGTSGIGAALVAAFLAAGDRVYTFGRSPERVAAAGRSGTRQAAATGAPGVLVGDVTDAAFRGAGRSASTPSAGGSTVWSTMPGSSAAAAPWRRASRTGARPWRPT